MIGIRVDDHVIIGRDRYISLKEEACSKPRYDGHLSPVSLRTV